MPSCSGVKELLPNWQGQHAVTRLSGVVRPPWVTGRTWSALARVIINAPARVRLVEPMANSSSPAKALTRSMGVSIGLSMRRL